MRGIVMGAAVSQQAGEPASAEDVELQEKEREDIELDTWTVKHADEHAQVNFTEVGTSRYIVTPVWQTTGTLHARMWH